MHCSAKTSRFRQSYDALASVATIEFPAVPSMVTEPSPARASTRVEAEQRVYFDRIADEYAAHYDDEYSREYRNRYLHAPMFEGIDLRGRRALDGMCGSGALTAYMRDRGARVVGLDISAGALRHYKKSYPDAETVEASFLKTGLPDASVDVVAVVGGLHHLQPHVREALDEAHRILRPGGYFVFTEPEAWTLPDVLRRLWYKVDRRYFAANEAAVNLKASLQGKETQFELVRVHRGGGLAYFLVLNSLVFRMPRRLKATVSRPLLRIDRLIERLLPRRLSSFAVVQLRKR
jgi:ubiquinone/menaquinone biosynthesis C-methylase UbiE